MTRTAIVTGAARGLGEAIARRLAADGDRVLLADVNVGDAERVAAEIGGESVEHDEAASSLGRACSRRPATSTSS